MSVIWADDFSIYGGDLTKLTDGIYAEATAGGGLGGAIAFVEDPDPLQTGNVIKLTAGAATAVADPFRNTLLRYALPEGAETTLGISFRIWFDDLPTDAGNACTFEFTDINNVSQVSFYVHTSGVISAWRGQPAPSLIGYGTDGVEGTLLGASLSPCVTAGAWTHLEFKINIHDSTGTVELRANGITKINLTGQDTKMTAETTVAQFLWNNVYLYSPGSDANVPYHFKDFVVWDTAGSQNNDFLGSVAIIRLDPSADISFNWTPSSGTTGYNLIDEYLTVDDTDKITADSTPPASSVFALTNLPVDTTSVKALITVARARKVDGGDANLQVNLISNGDTALGTDQPMTTAFTYWKSVSEISPDTAVAWTPAEVNATNVEVDRTL